MPQNASGSDSRVVGDRMEVEEEERKERDREKDFHEPRDENEQEEDEDTGRAVRNQEPQSQKHPPRS